MKIISKRTNSIIYLIEKDNKRFVRKVIDFDEFNTMSLMHQAYKNVMNIQDKCPFMVKVYHYTITNTQAIIDMEYLDGYTRLEYSTIGMVDKVLTICKKLSSLGYIWLDASPINLMEKDGDIKMIDLDTVVESSRYPETPTKPCMDLTWYASRMIKLLKGDQLK